MKNNLYPLICSMLISILLVGNSCQKSTNNGPQPGIDPTLETVTASLKGRVLDENGKPVSNAAVKSGSSTTATDINGQFRFDNIQLSKNAGFVTVEKTGYIKGSRTIFTNTGNTNYVEIQLIPRTNRGNFTASAGGNINIQSGSSVNFPANGIINNATNAAYSGTVNVIGAYLDPTDPKLSAIMPGNLTGLTASNEQRVLQTYGMIVVELEGSGGEKLNLATGKTATITMPIPASLQGSAPASIPLWYFDETKGLWREEGSAAKQGTNYVGTVSHFSFWNCDVPASFINLKLTLKNQSAQPLASYRVSITNTQNDATTYGYTDSTGTVSGGVPNNATLQLKVYNKCNTVIHTQNVGPYSSNTDLGVVTVTTPATVSVTVSGTVTNCSFAPVTNGFVDLSLEGLSYRAAVNNGSFSITIDRCGSASAVLQAVATDLQASQQSSATAINVTTGNASTGAIQACGTTLEQYVTFSVNGSPINFIPPADSLSCSRNGSSTFVYSFRVQGGGGEYQTTSFMFTGAAAPGTYPLSGVYVLKGNKDYVQNSVMNATITEYGSPGQFVAGNFSGNIKDSSSTVIVPVTCNFRFKRSL